MESKVPTMKYSLRRLERLADTIFAIAIMLLIVKIDFAPRDLSSAAEAYAFLWKSSSQSLGFAISFLLVAYYWISHQTYFGYYTGTNMAHIFLELLFLLAIAGMPLNNDFIEAFPDALAPRIAISSDIFMAGIFTFFSWSYATAGNRLIDPKKISPETVKYMRDQALVMPVIAIIAVGAAFIHPLAWDAILFVGPILGMKLITGKKVK
jgi:uncharacterized membrane protein